MAVRRNVTGHPAIQQWVNARLAAGHGEDAAKGWARCVNAMVARLNVEPGQLPADAVARHFEGRPAAPTTVRNYTKALAAWFEYCHNGLAERRRDGLPADMNDPDLLEWAAFLDADGMAPNTVGGYTRCTNRVVKHSGNPARELTRKDVVAYLEHLQARARAQGKNGITRSYRAALMTSVRSFCKFAGLEDATDGLKSRGADSVRHVPIPREDLKNLLFRAEQEMHSEDPATYAMGRTMRAMLLLMSGGGLRISETYRVSPAHLRHENHEWRLRLVQAKGRRDLPDVWQPVPEAVAHFLLANFQPHEMIAPADWNGNKASLAFCGWTMKHGVVTSAHKLRAFYATDLYRRRPDIVWVQTMMRHAKVETTRGYIHHVPDAEHRSTMNALMDDLITPPTNENVIPLQRPETVPLRPVAVLS
ncbi:site-specific integrase [Streptomyces rubiginosohelvolus]|uniref:tyrosine-type recombinase/integrase n=1 Tax=Streptomyces rubiginosohelvolus TaxID=67362 RepID=UPI0033A230B9